jgi:glycosyltransferase involved in cell wall biosynthesis
MRIAHVVPSGEQPWSGVLTVIVHLAAALARHGHHVEVWQLHDWDPARYAEERKRLRADGVVEVLLHGGRGLGRSAARLADERSIDVVHLHGAFNPSNTAVARGLRRPYVFSPHSGYHPVSLARSMLRKRAYRLVFERTMLRRAATIVALTDLELEHVRRFGAPGPYAVIPTGVEPVRDDVDRNAFRAELGLHPDTPLALFVGRLDVDRKGLDLLVRGVAEAPRWQLALVGPAFRDVDRLHELVRRLDIGDRVHLPGERHGHRLHEVFAAADVFTLLSRWEGLPMALLEALATSTPAVVSHEVERAVPVEAAGAGWSIDGPELGSLLRKLAEQYTDELRTRGAAALELAARYDWNVVAERYGTTYKQIADPAVTS